MKNNSPVEKKIDAALSSIDNMEPAIPSPYFYTRVLAKINNAKVTVWEKWSTFFLRPTIAFAVICFIVVLNVLVLYSKLSGNLPSTDQTELVLSDEYNEPVTVLYDLENVKP